MPPQEKLIEELNRVNRGWTNYHRRTVASKTFHSCDNVLYLQLRRWAKRRHPHKGGHWIANEYWHEQEGKGWHFRSQEAMLWKHGQLHLRVAIAALLARYRSVVYLRSVAGWGFRKIAQALSIVSRVGSDSCLITLRGALRS
jgi:DNA-directed RNA polymerase specialized sigma24 family protein